MATEQDLYRFHCENLRHVSRGMDRIQLTIRRAISSSDDLTTESLVRLYALLVGTWAECRLKKALYEPSGFDAAARNLILSAQTQHDCWKATVEAAFRKRFKVAAATLDKNSIPFTAAARYAEALELLETELRPIIELRNKLAHGQWRYLLTNDGTDVSTTQMAAFARENFLTLQYKRDLLAHLASLINDLVVSVAFDRDFDDHHRLITYTQNRLRRQKYQNYVAKLRARYARGKAARTRLPTQSSPSTPG
jgi:hypothetical protein